MMPASRPKGRRESSSAGDGVHPILRITGWVLLFKGFTLWATLFVIGVVCVAAGNTLARVIGVVLVGFGAAGAGAMVRRRGG